MAEPSVFVMTQFLGDSSIVGTTTTTSATAWLLPSQHILGKTCHNRAEKIYNNFYDKLKLVGIMGTPNLRYYSAVMFERFQWGF